MNPMNQQTSIAWCCEAAQRFHARNEHRLFIDGRQIPAASNKTFDTFDPSTGAMLGRLAEGAEADIDLAVWAARAAFEGPWSRWTPTWSAPRWWAPPRRSRRPCADHQRGCRVIGISPSGPPLTKLVDPA